MKTTVTVSIKVSVDVVEDQSRNGVKVLVHRYPGGTTVEADCQCFGSTYRTHSNENCVNRLRQMKENP